MGEQSVIAGYRVVRELGRGGMGEVYLVEHPRLPRLDALKLLDGAVSREGDFKARFVRESELLAQLKHPNIIQIYDRGEFDDRLWIAMEFVDGPDTAKLVVERGPMPMPLVLDIIDGIAAALDHVWQANGLTHRDVKPANILVSFGSNGALVENKLADFGIAKAVGETGSLTSSGMTLGTLKYMSPEAINGEPLDNRADQYSLACTAFALLAGAPPFRGEGTAVAVGHLTHPVPPLSTMVPVAPAVDMVMFKALAKRAADRYPSCRDFAAALRHAAASGGAGAALPTPAAPTQGASDSATSPQFPHFDPTHQRVVEAPEPRRRRIVAGVAVMVVVALGVSLLGWRIMSKTNPQASDDRPATTSATASAARVAPLISVPATQLLPSDQDVRDLTSNDPGFWTIDRGPVPEQTGVTVTPAECTWVANGTRTDTESSRASASYRHPTPTGRLTFGMSVLNGAVVYRSEEDAKKVFTRLVTEFAKCSTGQIQLTSQTGNVTRIVTTVVRPPSDWQLWSTMTYQDVGYYCFSSESRVRNSIVSVTRCVEQQDQSNALTRLTDKMVALAKAQ
ncbi:serine/threonine-protein kinase PknH/PknJ [Tsukamurella strandjordii]|uniref:non-specific serine/threonine protein kinase n=1 Tax=Tsukamurella strandjordii TaxID=147577 RepID=A0AA90NAF0_9ACTN|nr:serine/threonine-protein kinase PknH/PknJ [Tsukamurella strandjordii]MDP0397990.1 serine/threonine-protein kinase PknH/PknJ [Tsukamurella strandjordii]